MCSVLFQVLLNSPRYYVFCAVSGVVVHLQSLSVFFWVLLNSSKQLHVKFCFTCCLLVPSILNIFCVTSGVAE